MKILTLRLIIAMSVAAVTAAYAGRSAYGANPPPPPSSPSAKPKPGARVDAINAISMELQSQDLTEVEKGIATIRQRFKVNGEQTARDFRAAWYAALMKEHRFDDASALCLEAACAHADDVNFLEGIAKQRVDALLAAGRDDEALQAAKGLYNVCFLKRTPEAINLIADVLITAQPEDGPKAVRQFEDEQIAGAERKPPAATRPTGASGANHLSILAGIKIDEGPYRSKLSEFDGRADFKSLYARGNLLLLADRSADAMQAFRQAYAVAPEKSLGAATEALARAMRAQDGTVGRAGAWIMSLRPGASSGGASSQPSTEPVE